MRLIVDRLLEDRRMRCVRIGYIFLLGIMAGRRRLWSVGRGLIGRGGKPRPRMQPNQVLVSVKDLILRWRLGRLLEVVQISWGNRLRSRMHGNMCLDLCC